MAWTRSAQGRGNYVLKTVAAAIPLGRDLPHRVDALNATQRFAFAAAAAVLTFVGLLIPSMSVETLSSAMFFSGALTALLALRPPFEAANRNLDAAAAPRETSRAAFSELVARPDRASVLDRQAWAHLTARMSHELRTPLNAVLGFSELMSSEAFGPMGARCYSDYARDIHASGRMLLKSAEDALAITALLTAEPAKGALKTCRLAAAAADALAFHGTAIASRNISTTAHFADDDFVLADAQTVRQLLINLVAEALGAARDGACVAICACAHEGQMRLVVTVFGADAAEDIDASFNMQLARTLADLSGARLSNWRTAADAAETIVEFTPAAQRDFFAPI